MSEASLKLAFLPAETPAAQEVAGLLRARHGEVPLERAAALVALGGDGAMLQALHVAMPRGLPVYGMNLGSVGFLLNPYQPDGLVDRIMAAQAVALHPLLMQADLQNDDTVQAHAINEVSLLRETRQTAKLRIFVDGKVRVPEMICDGALVSTAVGSTAYNFSAHGPILPINANVLALTPISAFRPRRWRGALLPADAEITFEALEADKRPVSAVADFTEVRDVRRVTIKSDPNQSVTLLFDPGTPLGERILTEQFAL